uniref:Tyrosine--tRNA ligase n=1 Tax=uncultured bacterium W5-102b TaxID=1130996 RepID=H9BWJ0_9BACT|nr:tyrosyl-tRNA synthetase [uncultured bacterium W5-102b]
MTTGVADIAAELTAPCVDVLPESTLEKVLAKADAEGRQLRVKLGVDPTTPDLHIGHAVVLQQLRRFQNAGHLAVLIIGDYTARIGDPSGRDKTRPVLTGEEIDANADTYRKQAFRIIDEDQTELRNNGEWLSKLTSSEIFKLIRRITVARILERDDFKKRFVANEPISMLELMYPIMQGYDSVVVEADIELGGTDQLYNLLLGRFLQGDYGRNYQQVVMTTPLLVGTDGTEKMSKSLGNYIAVEDSPEEMFGKTMSIPDAAMPEWFRYATALSKTEVDGWAERLTSGEVHHGEAKRALGRAIVERFHSADAATRAEAHFDQVVRDKGTPDEIPEVALGDIATNDAGLVFLPHLLTQHAGVASNGEARRLLKQGGVRLDGDVMDAATLEVKPGMLAGAVLKVGKRRFLRITP